ncbi:MAG: VWA domain-containing protein [Candidatus Sulfotelmatobacter sp.]
MGPRHPLVLIGSIGWAIALATCSLTVPHAIAIAQQAAPGQDSGTTSASPAQPPQAGRTDDSAKGLPVFKSEVRVVLVDSVVTDKKGNYIRDLTANDFRVWEDNKEQRITSFSMGDDPAAPDYSQRKYLVLAFDTSTRDFLNQVVVRQAAAKFIDANVAPNRQMAVVDFGSSLRVAQNFTSDADRLKKAVADLSDSSSAGMTGMRELDLVRALRFALTSLAKSLSTVPGRKTLVMFTRGFPLPPNIAPELTSEIMAAINECNKANIAIYPIDVRALAPNSDPGRSSLHSPVSLQSAHLVPAAFHDSGNGLPGYPLLQPAAWAQIGRGQGGSGSMPGVPPAPEIPSRNQQVLDEFAANTGGFVIMNTNDVLGGLEKIGKEQSQYYVLGYSPSESPGGSCHTLKVKVDRGGTIVRSRRGYCNVRPRDLLAGSTIEKRMETQASADMLGNITGSMEAPFFYISPNTARVNLALEIPSDSVKLENVKGKMHAEVNILGIAYRPDDAIAARFSDTVNLDFADQQEVDNFTKAPFHYENQFEISSGKFLFKVVFSSGNESFGKLEKPLVIDPYNGNQFALSGLALSNQSRRAPDKDSGSGFALLDRTRLIAQGMEITPSASNRFKATDAAAIYAEVYEPLLARPNPPHVGIRVIVRDRKSGAKKLDIGVPNTDFSIEKGSLVIRLGLQLPLNSLAPGSYELQLGAADSAGHASEYRSSDFEVE